MRLVGWRGSWRAPASTATIRLFDLSVCLLARAVLISFDRAAPETYVRSFHFCVTTADAFEKRSRMTTTRALPSPDTWVGGECMLSLLLSSEAWSISWRGLKFGTIDTVGRGGNAPRESFLHDFTTQHLCARPRAPSDAGAQPSPLTGRKLRLTRLG